MFWPTNASARPRSERPQLKRISLGGYGVLLGEVLEDPLFRFSSFLLGSALILAIAPGTPSTQSGTVPTFAEYKVDSIYHGPIAAVDITSSADARRFRTVLRQ